MISSALESLLPLYHYCEKNPGPIPQPLNFLSCIVFWLGAVWLATRIDEDDEKPSFHQVGALLLFLLGLTGMGWHVSGHPLALAADMTALFMLLVVVASALCNDILKWSLGRSLAAIVVLMFGGALVKGMSFLPQNAGAFLPMMAFMAFAALKAQRTSDEAAVYLLSGAYTLFFGLVAYSLDGVTCAYFPQGLHFLWHIMLVISLVYVCKAMSVMKTIGRKTPGTEAAQG